jgi:hypothetical protein
MTDQMQLFGDDCGWQLQHLGEEDPGGHLDGFLAAYGFHHTIPA